MSWLGNEDVIALYDALPTEPEPNWREMYLSLAMAVRPVLDCVADSPEWHAAELALAKGDLEVKRWKRSTSAQQTEQNNQGDSTDDN